MYDGAQLYGLYGSLFQTKLGSTTVGSNFVLGGGVISQGQLLCHHFPLKIDRLSLVYKLLGGGAEAPQSRCLRPWEVQIPIMFSK